MMSHVSSSSSSAAAAAAVRAEHADLMLTLPVPPQEGQRSRSVTLQQVHVLKGIAAGLS